MSSTTPSTPAASDASTNRILSQHIETPSPSSVATSSAYETAPTKSPISSARASPRIIFIHKTESEKKKKDEKVLPRTPILTKEILEKAGKIEEKLVAHKDAKVKFQLSYLLSPKKLRNYQKEKKAWKAQDPINSALENCLRQKLNSTPKKAAAPKTPDSKIEVSHNLDQKLDRKVIDELNEKFNEIYKILDDKVEH